MRGKEEHDCLEHLKISILDPDALGKQRMKCNYCCKERGIIVDTLLCAEQNPQRSEFPDFIFEDGFIEHFSVSSAKETRKGSEYRSKTAEINRKWDRIFEKEKEEHNNSTYIPNQMTISTKGEDLEIFTYQDYVKSFQKNWEKHIESLKKYSGNKNTGIFLVEYKGALLPEIRDGKVEAFYQVNRDKEILNYIYNYKDLLEYVIFVDGEYYEILLIADIPELIKKVPKGVVFKDGRMKQRQVNIFVNL